MPTLILRNRQPDLSELMDSDECDRTGLDRTYRHFRILNRMIAGWGRVYARWLRPRLDQGPATLVDIGCGGADVPVLLSQMANRDGYRLSVTGIDPDERAVEYARRHRDVELIRCNSHELAEAGRRFDFVVSNHLFHHLDDGQRRLLLADSEKLAVHAAIHNDIRRDDLGYAGFSILGLAFPGSFIRPDGLTSIQRSYTKSELDQALPAGWRSERIAPYRLLAVYETPRSE